MYRQLSLTFDPRFEIGFQIEEARAFDRRLMVICRELALVRLALHRRKAETGRLLAERKYSSDQPRVPAGNPTGGQWTGGGGGFAADPFNIDSLLSQWGSLAADGGLLFEVAAADIPSLTQSIMDWLGPGAFQQNSPNGAIQFFSADRSRQIRFDITPATSHGLSPHINIEPGRRHIFVR